MDDQLRSRLLDAGFDPTDPGDPASAWAELRKRHGPRITIIDRYALEAYALGIAATELTAATRRSLADEVLAVQFPGIELIGESSVQPIEVVAYDMVWPELFLKWKGLLSGALGPAALAIHHVGSTSVPGLSAKPVIDIEVSVADLEAEHSYVPAIESLDLPLRSRDSSHRYFRPGTGQRRTVHVHVCALGSQWSVDHVLFRDYLRANPAARDGYGELKTRLAEQYRGDRLAYTDAKAGFILDTLDAAREWADATGWSLPHE